MLTALLCLSVAQTSISGVYRPSGLEPVAWSVNQHHTLIWNGQPYVPMGVAVDGNVADVSDAITAGAKDLIVRLPVGGSWQPVIDLLESKKINYLVEINSAAKPAKGVLVQPETYRRSGITEEGSISFPLVGASSAYAVVVTQRNSSVNVQKRFKAQDGLIRVPVNTGGLEHVLLVYPETTSMAQPDYWDEFDTQRDDLLATLKGTKFGTGLRGVVDPIGQAVSLFGEPKSFVPTSNAFRMELRSYLTEKYRNYETATRAWGVGTNDFSSMDDLTKLVPLYTDTRGVKMMWNPDGDFAYQFEPANSTAWVDIDTVIRAAAAKRYDRLVSAIRQVVDVPVVQRWSGWRGPYEASNPSLCGIGISATGESTTRLVESAAPAASSLFRWQKKGWLIATNITSPRLSDSAAELGAMGVRGFFGTLTKETREELEKLVGDTTLSEWSPTPLYYPEAASNPAAPMRLPGGYYWLPSPVPGIRLEMGSLFAGYRYDVNGQPTTVLWGLRGPGRVKMRLADPKSTTLSVKPLDGGDPQVRVHKNAIEVNLSEFPTVFSGIQEVPVPEAALVQTIARFEQLGKMGQPRQIDLIEEKFNFKNASAGFDRGPGASFAAMRRQYWMATSKLAPYTWVEAEASRNHNFSEVSTTPGTNGGASLRLKSIGPIDPRGSFAEYVVPIRYTEDQEIWVAGIIPPEARPNVLVKISGMEMGIQGDPVQRYANGYSWYRLGVTKLSGTSSRFQLVVNNSGPTELFIDTIFIAPVGMVPNGPLPPEIVEEK